MPANEIRVANWNLEWALPSSWRGEVIRERCERQDADVICLTEAYSRFLRDGSVAEAAENYGYPVIQGRRKVSLWSRWPLHSIDQGPVALPSGRYVSAIAETPLGAIKFVGVCIPWRDAHVRTGQRNRQPWQDHIAYLRGLGELAKEWEERTIVLGDFNQRVPPRSQPERVVDALREAMGSNLQIATEGLCDENGSAAIDHLALTSDLAVEGISLLPSTADGRNLSDHFGWTASISIRDRR